MSRNIQPYKLINLSLAGVILCIIIYSGIFNYKTNNFPIHSFQPVENGKPALSVGLSRSFSAIVRFDFATARAFNRYGIQVFMFFFIQLFLRLFFLNYSRKKYYTTEQIVLVDVVISVALFAFCFKPFIIDCFS